MNIFATIERLSSIFSKQLEIYKQLTRLTSSLSADISRTKGNMNGLTSRFEKENNLIEEILNLKEQAANDITVWQENKHTANEYDVKKLDNILNEVEEEIKRFLAAEKILKKQVEYYKAKDGTQ